MRRKMCDRAKTAIDIIKSQKKKTLSREETIMLFEKVIEDNEKMGVRMTDVEKRLSSVESKVDKILLILEKPNFLEKIFFGEYARYAWILLIIALLIIGALMGVPLTGFNGIISAGV